MKVLHSIGVACVVLIPAGAVFAQTFNPSWILSVVSGVGAVMRFLVPVLVTVALAAFLWGVIVFMAASDDKTREDGKKKIVLGIIALAIIVSVWGLVTLLQRMVGVRTTSSTTIGVPQYYFGASTPAPPSGPVTCSDGSGWAVGHPCCIDTYNEEECQG